MREPTPPEERGTAPPAGSSSGAPAGGLPPAGTSAADVIGLTAVGTQFGLAGLQAARATEQLTTGPLRTPGMLLALAMAGQAGWAAFARMQSLAFLRGQDSLAGAALALGGDGLVLETSAIRFMLADRGFFTDPLVTVPLSEAGGQAVVRAVTFQLDGDVTIRGVQVSSGGTLLVEYLANGLVRVRLQRGVGAGAEVRADSGLSAGGEALTGVSWLMANDREAARLVAALTAAGGASVLATGSDGALALALAGGVAPIPRPQTWTVGQGASVEASVGGDLGPPGASPWGTGTLVDGSLAGTGQVTVDELGNRTYALQVEASVSSGLPGPVLDALRSHLPGESSHVDPNIIEGSGGLGLEVTTDAHNSVREVSVTYKGSFGQGSGLSTPGPSGQSTSGESVEVKLTLDRQQLEAAGADGRRVLEALAHNRADEAARALERLVARGDIEVDHRDYTRISGGVEAQRGTEGASAGGEITIETAR